MKAKDKIWLFYGFYFVLFWGQAIHGAFLPTYLNHAGMTEDVLGVVNGITQVLCFFLMPAWGLMADRYLSPQKVLFLVLAASTVMLYAFTLVKSIWVLAWVQILFTIFFNPQMGMSETIAISYSKGTRHEYGIIRMCGTIGYAIMSFLVGFQLSQREDLLFFIYIVINLACIAVVVFLPDLKVAKEKKKQGGTVYVLLKDKEVRMVLILLGVTTFGGGFNGTFFGIHLTNNLNGTYAMIGVAHAVMAIAELPFHLGPGRRWLKRIGVKNSLLVVMAVGIVRYAVAALCNDPVVFMMTMAFNGIMLVPTIVGVVEFMYERAPEHLKASAQNGLKYLFTVTAGVIANVAGGFLVSTCNDMGMQGIRIGYGCLVFVYLGGLLFGGLPVLMGMRKR